MANAWKLKEEEDIAILEFDTPDRDVNVLSTENMSELASLLGDIQLNTRYEAVLITSAKKKIFIAGADIKEIEGIRDQQEAFQKAEGGKAVLKKIEDLSIPTIAVINGACLGGGYELALACQWRVCSFADQVKIGLPEVNLGILPGFGGTQRLPRLVGLVRSLPLILAGKVVSWKEALKYGMVDRAFPEKILFSSAVQFAKEVASGETTRKKKKGPWYLEKLSWGRALVFNMASKDVEKRTKGQYPAPFKIIDLLEETITSDIQKGFRRESEAFAELAVTGISKNLIKLFFLSERYKKHEWTGLKGPFPEWKQCGIVGAGVMGGGIAQLVSYRNIPVRMKDITEQALGGALKEARRLYEGALKRRKLKRHEVDLKMGFISVCLNNDGLKRSQIIIEAVVEDMAIKKKVFQELAALTDSQTILASNTSALSVTEMAAGARFPERVIGLHFFNPVHRMPLIEIIRSETTSEETLERTVQFARKLGKTVIVVKDVPGFLVNRLLLPYLNEAAFLMEDGMAQEKVDQIALEFGMPMGPVELVDHVGIDVGYKVAKILEDAYQERMKMSSLLHQAKDKNLLGKKSGKGFYLYKGKGIEPNPEIRIPDGPKHSVSEEDALKRMMYIMINEAARCLEEKVVEDPGSVDIGMVMGTGFAPFRAGLLHYADDVGLKNVVVDLKRFQETYQAIRFEPSPYLVRLAGQNKGFYS